MVAEGSALVARRHARLTLAGLAAALVLAVLLAAWLITGDLTPHPPAAPQPPTAMEDDWDWAGETALATRPMPYLPLAAAMPQPLAPKSDRPPLRLPAPRAGGGWIAGGFPGSPEGAVAQLSAMTTQGLRDGDPDVYQRAYASLAAPGAPSPAAAKLTSVLTTLRATAHLSPTGAIPELSFSFVPTHAQIKGVLDGGRYAVVCVLGEMTTSYQERVINAIGLGDCQAMRYLADPANPTGGTWRISPGAAAAASPDAWPGSQDSINVGFQAIDR